MRDSIESTVAPDQTSNQMTISISRSKFIELAREGFPVRIVQQPTLPDVPTMLPTEYFAAYRETDRKMVETSVASSVPGSKRSIPKEAITHLVAWMLLPTSSQDTRMVIDKRAELQANKFREIHGVTNTITAEGTSVLLRNHLSG